MFGPLTALLNGGNNMLMEICIPKEKIPMTLQSDVTHHPLSRTLVASVALTLTGGKVLAPGLKVTPLKCQIGDFSTELLRMWSIA
jgi:hypothetical protein